MSSRSSSPENNVFNVAIVPDRQNKAATTTSCNFDGLLKGELLLHEDLTNGCGGQLWPAGMTLSKYMLKYHNDLTGKSIVEIGAGGGLVGLAVASGCSLDTDQRILITDQIPMLSLMQQNIALNNLEPHVEPVVYDWGDQAPERVRQYIQKSSNDQLDLLLAADCVYFEPAFPLLLETLKDMIGPSTTCYFCFKKRRKADMRFIRDLKKTFMVEDVDYAWKEEDRKQSIFLYSVKLRPSI